MVINSSPGLRRARHVRSGFSLIEALVSMVIIGILSVAVVLSLRSTKRTQELSAAARVLVADLRSLQARALTAQNVKICPSSKKVCEDPSVCPAETCKPVPPFSFGAHLSSGASTYSFFAEVDTADRKESAGERLLVRDLARSGGSNVTIEHLLLASKTVAEVDVAFERQNGKMHLSDSSKGATMLTIRLQHMQSGATREIALNALSGRITSE